MRAMGDGVLSLSSDRWRYHSAGGMAKVAFMDSQVRHTQMKLLQVCGRPCSCLAHPTSLVS